MGQGGRTGERFEMVAAKVGNYTPGVEEIDLWVARIECLCSVYFQVYYRMRSHCHLGVVESQTGHLVELYWWSSVEICWLTLYVNRRW
jgi:hypothetical protein